MNSTFVQRPRKRSWYAASAAVFRWLHIYLSMLGFATLMFFAVTGITLNHPTWFGASEQHVRDVQGVLPKTIAIGSDLSSTSPQGQSHDSGQRFDKLGIVEYLRSEHQLKGRVTECEVDEFECMVVFKGPGYSADVFIDRETNQYTLTETTTGMVAVLNDLHKGRDSGKQWAWVIDVSAMITMLLSLSGFGLLFYVRKRRVSGLITAVVGTVIMVVAWAFWVP